MRLRFNSSVGLLSVEDLWDLPLSARGADLNKVAQTISRELKEVGEESFVEIKPNPRKDELELQLEIAKHVIAVQLEQKEERKKAADNAERRRRIMEIIDKKQDAELESKTKEELEAELLALSS
jgi:hypothetical protein